MIPDFFLLMNAWPLAGDSFEHFAPSSERGLPLILLVCLFVVKVEKRRRVLRLRIFQCVDVVLSLRVEGVVELI